MTRTLYGQESHGRLLRGAEMGRSFPLEFLSGRQAAVPFICISFCEPHGNLSRVVQPLGF